MRPLVATVDLAALRHNYQYAKTCTAGRKAFAVVKANAYGHGAAAVVAALAHQADGFAVACMEEAEGIRAVCPHGRLLLLEGCFEATEYQQASALGLDVVVQNTTQLNALLTTPLSKPLAVWLKLDSGMHRLGWSEADLRGAYATLLGQPQVAEVSLISHFACADEPEHPLTNQQLMAFERLQDLPLQQRSLANSAAILTRPDTHQDWIRPGIMLYGASPFADRTASSLGLQPVMSLTARLIAIRTVPMGESVGYGATWVAHRLSRIGTVSCGYADGYPRHAPSGTPVVIRGQRVPLAGRVSMDMLAVDLTDLPEANLGDEVELWGDSLSVDELAQRCGTIGYELLTKVTPRVPRQYR